MKTLYIRTEANIITATGHMMRCLAIADRARRMDIDTVFIVAEEASGDLPRSNGYKVIVLGRQWDDFDGEIPVISELIKNNNIKCMLVDSYFVTERYMKEINKLTKTAYIDDLHTGIWPVEVIIDYAVYYDLFDYDAEYPNSKKLLGPRYMPLRPEYEDVSEAEPANSVSRVLCVTGGSDNNHFLKKLADAICRNDNWKNIEFTMVLGRFNKDYDVLCGIAGQCRNIKIMLPVPSLKQYIAGSDVVITAGGTTLYELAACGVPGIAVRIADNQHYNVDGFARRGLILDAGDVEKEDFNTVLLEKHLDTLINDYQLRKDLSRRCRSLVDGCGTARLVEELSEYL